MGSWLLMSNYIYSPSQNMIIPVALKQYYIDARTWPDDPVEISDETAGEFSLQFPQGKMMSHDENNQLCWIDLTPPTHEEKIATAEAQKQRLVDRANDYINRKQWPGKAAMGRLSDAEKMQYNDSLDYLDALEDIDAASAPEINWPTQPF